MSEDNQERELRSLFRTVNKAIEHGAPTFDRVWQQALLRCQSAHPRRTWFGLWATALLVVLLSGSAIILHRRPAKSPHSASIPANALALSEWESPTDFLLLSSDNSIKTTSELEKSIAELETIMLDIKNGGVP